MQHKKKVFTHKGDYICIKKKKKRKASSTVPCSELRKLLKVSYAPGGSKFFPIKGAFCDIEKHNFHAILFPLNGYIITGLLREVTTMPMKELVI